MTDSPGILPTTPAAPARRVLFLAFPGFGLLDLTGAQTVFWAADKALQARGRPGYERITASVGGGLVDSAEGLPVQTTALGDCEPASVDTLVTPGAPQMAELLDRSAALVDWLRLASPQARRTASVCSGAFLLAAAGLLDGRRATTHWLMFELMHERYPRVEIDRDAIFVREGQVWTSAGVTAGIDLALALVEADAGHEIAMEVARELVVFLKRPGGQSQFSALLRLQAGAGPVFEKLNLWISAHLQRTDLSVETLAAQAGMSPRHFAREYKLKTGSTPAKAVEMLRLEAARRMLEETARKIDQVALHCGFGDEERMRTAFRRHLGVAPRDYRARFGSGADPAGCRET